MNNIESKKGLLQRWLGLPLLAILALLATGMGMYGFAEYYAKKEAVSVSSLLYQSLQLFSLESGMVEGIVPWELQFARFFAPTLTFVTLAKALLIFFREEVRDYRLSRSKEHIVICGAGEKAAALIHDFLAAQRRVVTVDLAGKPLTGERGGSDELFPLHGDASCLGVLKQARLEWAERVFVTTGNDSTNIEIAAGICHLLSRSVKATRRLTCHIHLVDRQTAELFRNHCIFSNANDFVDIHIFNLYDNTARLLWREHLLARGPIAPDDGRHLRLVICGLGQMGEAVLLRVLRSAHYANDSIPAVTIVDRDAGLCRERLLERYPALPDLCDLDFVTADLGHPETARKLASVLTRSNEIASAVFCLDDDYANFAAALQLSARLEPTAAHIYIRLARAAGLCDLLRAEQSNATPAKIIDGFGLIDNCSSSDLVLTDALSRVARLLHEDYVANQRRSNPRASSPSMNPWDSLDESLRDSNREQAEHVELKLRTLGYSSVGSDARLPVSFTDEEVELLGRMEHARWCAERKLAGWTYAPGEKDVANRTSPHLVPWEQLPNAIRDYDFNFVKSLPRILSQQHGT